MKTYYRDYRVVGSVESIVEFETLLGLINYCRGGASRTISVHVDGDGSANIGIKRIKDEEDREDLSIPNDWIEING